jgi:hypothetical protein
MTGWRSRPYSDSGEPESDVSFLVILNAYSEADVYLPPETSPRTMCAACRYRERARLR